MKNLIFVIFIAFTLIGCTQPQIDQTQDKAFYREAMKDGAYVSAVHVGDALCEALKVPTRSEACKNIQVKMAILSTKAIEILPDTQIDELIKEAKEKAEEPKPGEVAL